MATAAIAAAVTQRQVGREIIDCGGQLNRNNVAGLAVHDLAITLGNFQCGIGGKAGSRWNPDRIEIRQARN